ncbi:MAG TPA: class I SAM-dependent methyltransferase, partial [Roseiflexaceae bacterium]|nr:class I SAM-dependent methyltransferase [Roseiflexaceae bacterium]
MLGLRPGDIALDNGCGTAKFAAWNADKVGLMVGSDPATLFADAAVEQVALAKADSRCLPFANNSFDKAFSLDVLEHFPREVIDAYLKETARVLRPGGRFFIMSNTSDPSSLQPLTDASRKLGQLLVRAGLYDFQREARRKSDHIKALRTWQDVLDAMEQAGLRPVRIVFWNSVFTSFVEHVLMKLGEAALGRKTKDNHVPTAPSSSVVGPSSADGTHREIRARQRIRQRLERRGPAYYALTAVTLLMELDLWLFGALKSGSYCMVVEKPVTPRDS